MATKVIDTMVTYFAGLLIINNLTVWSRGLARSRDKQKPLYLYCQSVFGHQILQDDNLP